MKKLFILISFLLTLQLQAGVIRRINVESEGPLYRVLIWGRLDNGQYENLLIKDPAEIAKIAGIENQSEFGLGGNKPIRFTIHFADGTDPDTAIGTITRVDFHTIETKEFTLRSVTPESAQAKTVVSDVKTLIESKSVDGK